MNVRKNKSQVLLPFYHQVIDSICPFSNYLYKSKTITQFKNELDYLVKHYEPISLTELIQIKKNNLEVKKPSFHLTFDDGLANFYHVIAPILKEKNISATVFLNTDFIDNKALFYRYKVNLLIGFYKQSKDEIKNVFHNYFENENIEESLKKVSFKESKTLDELALKVGLSFKEFLKKEEPYLSINQIKELQNKGFTFGAHSKNHPLYNELSLEEQLNQTNESLNFLDEKIDAKHRVFSFPFHDIGVSKSFFDEIKNKVDLTFGTSGLKKDEFGFHLQRLDMEKANTSIKKFMQYSFIKYELKNIFGIQNSTRN